MASALTARSFRNISSVGLGLEGLGAFSDRLFRSDLRLVKDDLVLVLDREVVSAFMVDLVFEYILDILFVEVMA